MSFTQKEFKIKINMLNDDQSISDSREYIFKPLTIRQLSSVFKKNNITQKQSEDGLENSSNFLDIMFDFLFEAYQKPNKKEEDIDLFIDAVGLDSMEMKKLFDKISGKQEKSKKKQVLMEGL